MAVTINPVILTAKELEVHYGEQIILDKASLSIHEKDRIGLVGRNGAGKSTFLKIISGIMPCDSGDVAKRRDLVVGFLSQEFTLDETTNVHANILSGAQQVLTLIEEFKQTPFDSPNHEKLQIYIAELDGWNLEKNVDLLMKSLNAPPKERMVATLSGGEKRRVALCRALISHPDLLILDEPTNHLDTDSIEWIEDYLAEYSGTCIFVTHDRYFLDRIANRIVELSNGTFYSHQGNYTDYLINKSQRQAVKEIEENKRQNFLRRELEWVRRGPRARRTKAKSRLDNFYEVQEQQVKEVELDVEMIIPQAEKLGNKILELKNVGIVLGGKTLFSSFNYAFPNGKRIGVVGKNGTGKTTLLKILLGEISPTYGQIDYGERTDFNYVDQSRLLLNDDDTVIKAIGEGNDYVKFGKQQISVWTYLRRFLFTDERINTLVGRLSGGEKSRLTLARILKNGGNFLLLDEPTNDLDLPTLRVLEEALLSFDGCVVVVSHDRYFLNRVCNGIIALEGDGQIYFSEGDYDYYVQKRKLRQTETIAEQPKVKKEDTREKPKVRKLTWKESKELETMEENILNAEADVERIEAIFSSPDFYAKFATQTAELNKQLEEAKLKVKSLYERWEELEKIKSLL
ncbi:MAG: ATP-binding cassette domain-containing protein [Stygiobacter sp.]|nr:MAG: ABC transporter [Stygiobacter sp. GWC2_38_9]OGV08330.1 MAG: ABC transporter [Stygiobacter sp. RIFOXYB2_FULL_37_11]OGV12157.1 MAG: ABC transporter [Stygiobacter sp. RIFOXYC2_FULL_38_25]OGV12204.1 MAG: ABC transporter [Stygiobacter sp. RIFOXYA2_FULL_38_8]OGV81283.1 MAG: ABC transporter [Stygiobacter sp. GWF2_38_21]OGV83827.1 MAG: ABC transporter [Melioribacter sp. RIFOXYB12_FULL_38_5]RJQ57969.1 MAG: ATP-binding cassette domain-containing protein [Stygiobacter sp.]